MKRSVMLAGLVSVLICAPVSAQTRDAALDAGFRKLYELRFAEARSVFASWQSARPDDPMGPATSAASYLFEELYRQGVFTSEFFLDDRRFLEGIEGQPDSERRAQFLAANARAQRMAEQRLRSNARDVVALFVLAITNGLQADYTALIEKHHLESLKFTRKAETFARELLAQKPDSADAYLALGISNYIIGSLPAYKRFVLWFGGIHGDRQIGMSQLEIAAQSGHFLKPFAKILLALAALREKQREKARQLFEELSLGFGQRQEDLGVGWIPVQRVAPRDLLLRLLELRPV